MPTREQLIEALKKADAAGATEDAKVLARAIKDMERTTPLGMAGLVKKLPDTGLGGAAKQALNIPVGIQRGVEDVAETVLSPLGAVSPAFQRGPGSIAAQRRQAYTEEFGPTLGGQAGRFAGQMIGTGPVLNAMAGGVQMLGRAAPVAAPALNRLAQSIGSGGFVTGAAPATMAGRAGTLGLRAVGGGVSGATSAGLIGDDPLVAGVVGAGLPAALVPLGKAGISSAKFIGDKIESLQSMLTGAVGKQRAANILREALGDQYDAALKALQAAGPDATPEQVLVDANIDPMKVKAFMALGDWAAKRDPASIVQIFKTGQKDARQALLDIVGGGATETERLATRGAAKTELAKKTGVLREEALAAAQATTKEVESLGRKIVGESSRYDALAQRAKSLAAKGDEYFSKAANEAARMSEITGIPFTSEGTLQSSIAKRFKTQAENLGKQAQAARENLTAAQERLEEMVEQGLKPLNINTIIGPIQNMLSDPKIAVSTINEKALKKIVEKLQTWGRTRGAIDADALYEIRKRTISETIDELLPGSLDVKGKNEYAARLLSEIKPYIDNAITDAGGKKWGEYLKTYEQGAREIERLELAGEAARLFKESPDQFLKLVRGDAPEIVTRIFGAGKYDFDEVINASGKESIGKIPLPFGLERRTTIKEIARQTEKDLGIQDAAKEGYYALQLMLKNQKPVGIRLPNFFSPSITTANRVLDEMEQKFGEETVRILISAMTSGKNVADALTALPAPQQAKVAEWMNKAGSWGSLASRGVTIPATAAVTGGPSNTMISENRNAMRR